MGNNKNSVEDVQHKLGLDHKLPVHSRVLIGGVSAVVALLLLVLVFVFVSNDEQATRYKLMSTTRGDLTVKVTATGILEPVNQVEVGTEISGTVKTVVADFNDRVKRNQVLARLDTEQLEARVRQSKAAHSLALAKVREAEATVEESRNKFARLKRLEKKGLCAQEDCEAAEATFKRSEAALASARAQVVQAQAQLDADLNALSKAVIRAPIDGIVLKRQIEPGQTVTAALQTPVLFILAETLAQMELHVAVDEADVGQVREGQNASFTVDAFGDRSFSATISQVRYAPQSAEGVVTYETVLKVDNSDLSLRPGMTATAEIVTEQYRGVLLVPNAALRFTPPVSATEPKSERGLVGQLFPRRHSSRGKKDREELRGSKQRVWIPAAGQPVAVPVTVGATDGVLTRILEGELEPGQALIVDVIQTEK